MLFRSIDLDPRSIDILFANNKASTELFEEISGQVLGANRLSVNDPNYPIDLVKGKQLFDAKLSPEGSYKEKEAVRKVLNYKLDQSLSNYDYNQGSQSIRLSTPSLFGKELTPRKDALRTDETFSFVYPYFENIQTKDITNLDKQLSKRQRTMEALEKKQGNTTQKQQSLIKLSRDAFNTYGFDPQSGTSRLSSISGDKTIINAVSPYDTRTRKAEGGIIQEFTDGGAAKLKKTKDTFGTGETTFPRRVSNAYAKQTEKEQKNREINLAWNNNPTDERILPDEAAVAAQTSLPFDRSKFISTFQRAISRNTLYQNIGDFAKFIGLPQEDLSVVLPSQIDFGASIGGLRNIDGGSFTTMPIGSRGSEGWDLSSFGYTEKDKQDLFGYEKLLEEKKKLLKKILKTPVETFDDGSFSYDQTAYKKTDQEIMGLQTQISANKRKQSDAIKAATEDRQQKIQTTGRGTVSLGTAFGQQKNSVLYHELTHQLFNSLRTRSADSFTKYKQRVESLFNTDNDELADAFDSLGHGYKSADVVYGRSYKLHSLESSLLSMVRKDNKTPEEADRTKTLASIIGKTNSANKAREFRPINPDVNNLMKLSGYDQSYIDKVEDIGKEEFLTTLVQKAPQLDSNLQNILDGTLTELLGSAGIQRQQYATGGQVQRFLDGGWVKRMQQQKKSVLEKDLESL